ncbi:MAG: efflux RND transporter periplasmic adaptor subunit [candidate division Zixibacteria bacterium]|jgi:RND family efflux transporter MFP subunit|nr:efflux RND transporter periplasmic adaptor subunit [candidate division Zixibacteria bacterium]
MEQLYAENGVPVKTRIIRETDFSSEAAFHAVLTGIRESSAYAMVSDKIDHIDYQVGDFVEKDDIVMAFPTDNPSAQYYQAQVAFENAKATFDRMRSYYDTGGLSRQDYENAEAAYRVAEANWDAVRQSVMVKAPISGVLTRINARQSENVHEDDELFAVSQIDRLKARIWVSDKQIMDVKVGQRATARWDGVMLEGSVVQVDMSMNRDRQAFGVVIEFDNPDRSVRCGVTATISIEIYRNPAAVTIERKNIISDRDSRYVFVADSGVARRRPVVLGHAGELEVEILSGLSVGDELITEGQMHLEDGMKIRLISLDGTSTSNRP